MQPTDGSLRHPTGYTRKRLLPQRQQKIGEAVHPNGPSFVDARKQKANYEHDREVY
jgi:hypothetical protein